MRNNENFGVPPFDPQLHLFKDEDFQKKEKVVSAILPSNNETKLKESLEDEEFFKKRDLVISKYKVGATAQDILVFKPEEANENDDSSGWYVGNEKLKDWDNRMENLYNDKDSDYQYPWQRINNK